MGLFSWLFGGSNRQEPIIKVEPEPWPKGWVWFEGDVAVAGISKRPYQKAAIQFIEGTDRSVELVREPRNRYDPNAVKVVATWHTRRGRQKTECVGYLPRELAEEIATDERAAQAQAQVRTLFRPRDGKSAGIRLNIKQPPKPRKRKKK